MEPQESTLHAATPEGSQATKEPSPVRPEREILADFTPDQQRQIEHNKQVLSSLAYFIGKDFKLPVELNEPGQGWHWDFEANKVRVDPKDLIEKPMDYLRFVISHEGGHRRVSRANVIPKEEWQRPGFPFLMNSIEDPRTNNFVAESYPKFKEQMQLAYEQDLDIENHAKEKADKQLGHQPRFMQAGFEFIKQWFAKEQGKKSEISKDLPPEVQQVVTKTLESAEDAWLRYPSRLEADTGEEMIKKYAQVSYEIIRDEVWPEYKKLIEQDQQDQQIEQLLQDLQQSMQGGEGLPQDLQDHLSEEEQQALTEAMHQAQPESAESGESDAAESAPVSLSSVPEELQEELKKYIDSLPNDAKDELAKRARQALQAYEQDISDRLEGELTETPARQQESQESDAPEPAQEQPATRESGLTADERAEVEKYRELIEKEFTGDQNIYEEYRREVLPVIDQLENDLRQVFAARRDSRWLPGFRSGKRLNIRKRMQEKAKDVSVMQTRAFERRKLPQEKDYAVSVLVDLSGSMRGEKIEETFKGTIVLAEVLNRLSIKTEILGFNDRIHEFQDFGESMSPEVRTLMSGMIEEVDTERGSWNDDGWAVQQASDRLSKEPEKEKFLLVLSDGIPEPSPTHAGAEYDLSNVVSEIDRTTNQKLIGLGIGPDTSHVERFYPNNIANVGVQEMAGRLADVLREMVVNYDKF